MSIGLIALLSAATVACALTFALRLVSWQWLLRHAWAVDVVFTVGMFIVLNGTLGGALIAAFSGLMLSIALTVGKRIEKVRGAKVRVTWEGMKNV